MSEKSRFDHRIRALHRRAGLLKTEAQAISERFSHDPHQQRMERNAILWAIEELTKNEELAIKHPPPLYSTPTIGPERGEKTDVNCRDVR
jgi:hypothetical protein